MKVVTPLIAWHNRERVASADFQPVAFPDGECRLATGGDDKHVVIWELVKDKDGKVEPQCLCDLSRHQNSVNIIRWSSNGKILASGDTDSTIILWQYTEKEAAPDLFGEDAEMAESDEQPPIRRENWIIWKTLRGHLQDVVDICWSPCSTFLTSCSTDNTAIVFDTVKDKKVKILGEHKGWVNGVAWDPLNQYVATIASDRCLRLYKTKNYKIAYKTYKASLPLPTATVTEADSTECNNKENVERMVRLFHDDTFQSFYRRLAFSPDGQLLAVPSGVLEIESETSVANCTYVFSKANLATPALYLPNKEFSVAVRFSLVRYELRPVPRDEKTKDDSSLPPWERYATVFCLPYRMIYAVATNNSVVLYDTQQAEPFAKISKIHYVGLNDLAWSADGNTLFICSTDGYCTIASFQNGELGQVYNGNFDVPETATTEDSNEANVIAEEKAKDEVVSKDGIPLDSEGVASPARIHIRSVKEGGKPNPKRLQLITLSSPKSSKEQSVEATKSSSTSLIDEDDGATKDLSLVFEPNESEEKSEKKRVPLIPVIPAEKKTDDDVDDKNVAKVGRRVNLITLSSTKN